jgi:hypothetical protein
MIKQKVIKTLTKWNINKIRKSKAEGPNKKYYIYKLELKD